MMQGPTELITFLTRNQFLSSVQGESLLKEKQRFVSSIQLCAELVQRNWITAYQQAQLLSGNGEKLIIGSYRLQLPIGEGGMGMVFKAVQPKLDRCVALKIIRPQVLAARPEILSRFHREARAIAQLHHPNLVILFDADESNGTHYIAMEYVEGQTFEKMVRTNGPMGIRQACEYIRQSAVGLQHAHEVGLVHRDIKPSNILVSQNPNKAGASGNSSLRISRPTLITIKARAQKLMAGKVHDSDSAWGTVKILDMGLARLTELPDEEQQLHEETPLTRAGALLGTPDFIAPEQARDARKVDIRADIYSLGCTFYYMLTGKPPFPGGTDVQKLIRHQTEKPFPVEELRPGIPGEVLQILNRMLEKRAEDRYSAPRQLADTLSNYLSQQIGPTPVPGQMTAVAETPPVADTPMPAEAASTQRAGATLPVRPQVSPPTQSAARPRHGEVSAEPAARPSPGGIPEILPTQAQNIAVAKSVAVATVVAHPGPVGAVEISPDGRLVVSAGMDGKVRVWESGRDGLRELASHVQQGAEYQSVAFHPREDYVVVAGTFDGTARVWAWDWRVGEVFEWGAFRGDKILVNSLAFSPDGKRFAASIGAFVVCWKVASRDSAGSGKILRGHSRTVLAVAFSPDGKLLLSAGEGRALIGWGFGWLGVSQKIKLEGIPDIITSIHFTPNGDQVALAGMDGIIRILEVARPKLERASLLASNEKNPRLARYLPDNRTLAVVGNNGQIVVWNAPSAMKTSELILNTAMVSRAALTPSGRQLVLGTIDGRLNLYDLPETSGTPSPMTVNTLVAAR